MTDTAQHPPASPTPEIASVTWEDLKGALAAGWADFRAAPSFGLFFGGIYALGGIIIYLQLLVWDQTWMIFPLAVGFPLVGPFVAVGLYEVSRRRMKGEPLDWAAVLTVIGQERRRQMPMMAFVVLFIFTVWVFLARLMVALFFGLNPSAYFTSVADMLTSPTGLAMLVIGTVVGAVIALILFAATVVAMPLLLEREIDFVTAMITSFNAVRENLQPMLMWGATIAVLTLAASIPLFLGLIVVLPVLGHATWHVYTRVVRPEGAGA
ncbi:MAG: DUF2189 domain-containing protein [Pseudomonadota bacterium]